ncbi:MAG: hypothetical protein COT18_05480 [Elusimicrobia bacterium CG08_land_8_20_14_0_20_59_10]|nr:MAG: hypothetical protein COT18_05480 [Elusimicrobia bacterium CG08_land_8_20_14_0_20_59_10]
MAGFTDRFRPTGLSRESKRESEKVAPFDSVIFYLGLQEAIVDREEADKLGGIIIVDFPLLRFQCGVLFRN